MALNYLDLVLPPDGEDREYVELIASEEVLQEAKALFDAQKAAMGLFAVSAARMKRLAAAPLDELKRAQACHRFVSQFPEIGAAAGMGAEEWAGLIACDQALGQAFEAVAPIHELVLHSRYFLDAAVTEANDLIEDALAAFVADETIPLEERDRWRIQYGRARSYRADLALSDQRRRERQERRKKHLAGRVAQAQAERRRLMNRSRLANEPLTEM
jgi:hypothetical protein